MLPHMTLKSWLKNISIGFTLKVIIDNRVRLYEKSVSFQLLPLKLFWKLEMIVNIVLISADGKVSVR